MSLHPWKVYLKVHAPTKGLDGQDNVTSWTVVYNVRASSKQMAELLVKGDVAPPVTVDTCEAIACRLKDFKGVVDFVETRPELKKRQVMKEETDDAFGTP